MPKALTAASVKGTASHTPVIPHRADSKNAPGIRSASPLSSEIACAGAALSTEVKNNAVMILKPVKNIPQKYNLSPGTAILSSAAFPSLLKTDAITEENRKIVG